MENPGRHDLNLFFKGFQDLFNPGRLDKWCFAVTVGALLLADNVGDLALKL